MGGRKSMEDIVKMGKQLEQRKAGEVSAADPYAAFLSQRKGGAQQAIDSPLTKRWEMEEGLNGSAAGVEDGRHIGEGGNGAKGLNGRGSLQWTEGQDRSLVGALKEFPKDTLARWDKVAQAVPGKSKQQCFKRFSELREAFRGSKSSDGRETAGDEHLE